MPVSKGLREPFFIQVKLGKATGHGLSPEQVPLHNNLTEHVLTSFQPIQRWKLTTTFDVPCLAGPLARGRGDDHLRGHSILTEHGGGLDSSQPHVFAATRCRGASWRWRAAPSGHFQGCAAAGLSRCPRAAASGAGECRARRICSPC